MNARGVGGRPPAVLRINLNLRVILQIAVLLLLLWQARPLLPSLSSLPPRLISTRQGQAAESTTMCQ